MRSSFQLAGTSGKELTSMEEMRSRDLVTLALSLSLEFLVIASTFVDWSFFSGVDFLRLLHASSSV